MMGGGVLEVQCEVRASQTLARSRVVGISAHHVSLDIKAADTGKGDEVNAAVCGFMRSRVEEELSEPNLNGLIESARAGIARKQQQRRKQQHK